MADFHISIEEFGLLAGNFDDVLDIVMAPVESSLTNDKDIRRKLQIDKDIFVLGSKKSRMTDMLIDDTISREAYDEKQNEFLRKIHTFHDKRKIPDDSINRQKDVGRQMAELRKTLENEEILDEFDRAIFESIIDKVIVGGYDEDETSNPYRLTFVLKGNQKGTVSHTKERMKMQNLKESKVS